MKKIILLMIVFISLTGCYVSPRVQYYQRYPKPTKRVEVGKKYKPYFMKGRY